MTLKGLFDPRGHDPWVENHSPIKKHSREVSEKEGRERKMREGGQDLDYFVKLGPVVLACHPATQSSEGEGLQINNYSSA